MRSALVLACLLTACAAPPDTGTGDAGPSDARVQLGTGTSSFVEIPDGDAELELVAGPQGGWHVFLTARMWNLDVDGVHVAYEAFPAGGTEVVSFPTELDLTARRFVREGDHWLRAGDFLQLRIAAPADVVGSELDLRIRVQDPEGRVAEDVRRATIVDRE